MSYQNQSAPVRGARRKGLLALGVILLIGGVGTAVALFVASGSKYQEAVEALQRAPVGCDTEFEFKETGTFVFYTESKGEVGEIDGDCENADDTYNHRSGEIDVTLTLVDDRGDDVRLRNKGDISYDAGGFVGTATKTVEIDEPGEYTLSVESDEDDFAIAVGRNPKEGADSMKTTAFIVGGAGLILGLLFLLLGMRRRPAAAASAEAGGGFGGGFGGGIGASPGGFAPSGALGGAPAPQFGQGGPPLVSPPTQQAPGPYQQYPSPPTPPHDQPGGGWGAPPQ